MSASPGFAFEGSVTPLNSWFMPTSCERWLGGNGLDHDTVVWFFDRETGTHWTVQLLQPTRLGHRISNRSVVLEGWTTKERSKSQILSVPIRVIRGSFLLASRQESCLSVDPKRIRGQSHAQTP